MDDNIFYEKATAFADQLVKSCPQLLTAAKQAGNYHTAIEWVEDELDKMVEDDQDRVNTLGEKPHPFTAFVNADLTGSFTNAVAMEIVENHTDAWMTVSTHDDDARAERRQMGITY